MIKIFFSISFGIFLGIFFKQPFLLKYSNNFINIGLSLLLFFVGIDIGSSNSSLKKIKRFGFKIWLLPLSTIIGTLLGGYFASFFTSLSFIKNIAISSGLGWYSLSAIELSKVTIELGSIAFLSNVFREILSMILIPYISKVNSFCAISIAGATCMDTLLPIINKHNSPEFSILSFFSGIILTLSVPFLVSFFITLF